MTPISPADLAQLLPDPPTLFRDTTASAGIGFAHYRRRQSDFRTPPMQNHLIMVNIGGPARLLQDYGGHTEEHCLLYGDMTLLPCGHENRWRWDRGTELLHLYLGPEFLEGVAEATGMDQGGVVIGYYAAESDLQIQQLARWMWDEARAEGVGGTLYVESVAQLLAVHLLRHYAARAPKLRTRGGLSNVEVERITDYVNSNLTAELSLAGMAQVVHLSPYHFLRQFKGATGLTPHQFVIRARVEEAMRLLRKGGMTVGEAAARVGFLNQSQLALYFHRVYGVTPGAVLRDARR